jgi:hypothetical protein
VIGEKPISVIKFLMTDLGIMASMTQSLDRATCAAICEGFGKILDSDDDEDDYEDEDELYEDDGERYNYTEDVSFSYGRCLNFKYHPLLVMLQQNLRLRRALRMTMMIQLC